MYKKLGNGTGGNFCLLCRVHWYKRKVWLLMFTDWVEFQARAAAAMFYSVAYCGPAGRLPPVTSIGSTFTLSRSGLVRTGSS